jgi:bifunctional non-homologous end joining protein LigD
MIRRFVVQRHKTGRSHYDLRIIEDDRIRSWSILREPPLQTGEQRLAIEREVLSLDEIRGGVVYEDAFGSGKVHVWDEGDVEVTLELPERLVLDFRGNRLGGRYELRRMRWYPGNRWLIRRSGAPARG